MKTSGIVCIVALAGTLAASAATEQWHVTVTGEVTQIVADGSGGCAFLRMEKGTNYVVWLNRKGEAIYQSTSLGTMLFSGITECTPKQILFTIISGYPMMVQVSSKGVETPVAVMGGFVLGSPISVPVTFNKLADKKGFFIYNVNTNTAAGALVRYTFK